MNALALIAISLYFIDVSVKGNAAKTVALFKQDSGFIKWVIALFILIKIGDSTPSLKNYDVLIITAIIIGIESKDNGASNLINQLSNLLGTNNG